MAAALGQDNATSCARTDERSAQIRETFEETGRRSGRTLAKFDLTYASTDRIDVKELRGRNSARTVVKSGLIEGKYVEIVTRFVAIVVTSEVMYATSVRTGGTLAETSCNPALSTGNKRGDERNLRVSSPSLSVPW